MKTLVKTLAIATVVVSASASAFFHNDGYNNNNWGPFDGGSNMGPFSGGNNMGPFSGGNNCVY